MDRNIFQKDIEQEFSISRATVSNLVQLVEKKGYISREAISEDARLKKLVLTNKGIEAHIPDGSIEFKNVDFSYKMDSSEPVLNNINFRIESGETIGIIGGTGSFKTSLVNCRWCNCNLFLYTP